MLDYCKLFIVINVASLSFAQNNYCQEGKYGNNCELNCPKQCRPLQTFPCNKKTGKCSEGCTNGYHGDKCDERCTCPSGICFQESGECIGTVTTTVSTTKNTTQNIISTTAAPVFDGVAAGWRITAIILLITIFFMVCGGVVMFLCLKFKKKGMTLPGSWRITLSKAADADVSGDEENEIEQGKTLLLKEEDGVDATGGQNEFSKQHDGKADVGDATEGQSEIPIPPGDQPEVKQRNKENAQVEELKQQIKHLQEEKRRSDAQIERYQYRENVIQGLLVPILKSTKSSMSTNHLMSNKGLNKDNWLHCPHLMFDKETVNVKVANIDDNMVLRNIPDQNNPGNNSRRLQQFQGVICNEPLVKTGLYQYFEALFDIALPQPVGEGIIAQFGFCGEKDKEPITPFIDKPCFLVEVASSKKQDKICMMFIYKGKTVHMQEVMNNLGGSSHRVHIGICLKKDMKRIRIFDCGEVKYVSGTDIDIGEKIWPMFGVCAKNEASVSVQLIAGCDITMWKEKKEMLKTKHTKK